MLPVPTDFMTQKESYNGGYGRFSRATLNIPNLTARLYHFYSAWKI